MTTVDELKQIRDQVDERVREELSNIQAKNHEANPNSGGGGDNGDEKLSSAFVRECLQGNEMGDGRLFSRLHRNRFLYVHNTGEWLEWDSHHWRHDVFQSALSAVEDVATAYINEHGLVSMQLLEAVKENRADDATRLRQLQKEIAQRVRRLRSDKRQNVLKFSAVGPDSISISGDELDTERWKLGCANGIIDLRTGILYPGARDDFILKAAPAEYKGLDHRSELWEKTLLELMSGSEQDYAFLNRYLGSTIIGGNYDNKFVSFTGIGKNGKGLICEMISHTLGPLAGPIPSEMLLDQFSSRSSSGPSPDLMMLKGLRIAWASETDENRRISPSRVKWLTGNDTLVARNPHDKHFTRFTPTHNLILLTNHLPNAPAHDFAFWERCLVVPFKLSFVDRKVQAPFERTADKTLYDRLKQEASGILSWLVRGCLEWQQRGLDPPPLILEESTLYRRSEDDVADWIDECCELDPMFEETSKTLYDSFKQWYEDNISKKAMSHKRFGNLLIKKFNREKLSGYYHYYGLRLKLI